MSLRVCKNCKTQATFEIQEGGTYINELPLYFEEGLKQYKKKKKRKGTVL